MFLILGIVMLVCFGGVAVGLAKKTGGGSKSRAFGKGRAGGTSKSGGLGRGRSGSSRSKTGGRSGRAGSGSRASRTSSGRGSWLLKAWNSSGAPKTSESSFRGASAVLTGKAAGAVARGSAWATRKLGNITRPGDRDTSGMTCTKCGQVISSGERHVTIARNIEAFERGAFTVSDSEDLATYHERCEPKTNQQPFAGYEPASATPITSGPATTPPPVHVNPFRSSTSSTSKGESMPEFDRAAVPPTLAAHLNHIADLHPDNDAELLNFLKEEVTGMLAYGEAVGQMFQNCVEGHGLDPQAMQGVSDYAEATTENAQAAAKGHQQFLAVYEAIIQAANDGTVMPYNGRFFSGEAAA